MQEIEVNFMESSMYSEESELLMVVEQTAGGDQGSIQVMYVRRPGSGRRKSKPIRAPWHHTVSMSEPEEWLEDDMRATAGSQPAMKKRRLEVHGPCCHCGAVSSPQWRKGPKGKPVLCNACGIRFLRTRSLGKVPAPPAKRTPGNLLQRGKPSLLLPRQQSIGSGSDLESPELSPLESPAGIEMPSECALESPVLGTASSLGSDLAMEEMSEGSL